MINLEENEKKFVKRAITSTLPDLKEQHLDPNKKEDLIIIIKTFRSRGYITPRRMDHGKDFDMWYSVLEKLGVHFKDQKTLIREQEEKRVEGIMDRLNQIHTKKINSLEEKLKEAHQEKDKVLNEIEQSIQIELDRLDAKKKEALSRLEVAKTAHEKLVRYKKIKKEKKYETEDTGLVKCMECGEWFKAGAGIASHRRNKHPELEEGK